MADQLSPGNFIKPADLFKKRQTISTFFHLESPLKCLDNFPESPAKNLPTILRNPFQRPVKRKLDLGASPIKDIATRVAASSSPKSTSSSSPITKRSRMLGIAEDANAEPLSVKTIYQHPYISWIKLYPRNCKESHHRKENSTRLFKDSQITTMMFNDWCESLDDLLNLFIDGRCPYFYLYADKFQIHFHQVPTSINKKPLLEACISPISFNMSDLLEKMGVEIKYPSKPNLDSYISNSTRDQESCLSFVSDIDDETHGEDENEDASKFLEDLGLSQQEISQSLKGKPKGFSDSDSNTQTKNYSSKPSATIEGADGLRKLCTFLKTNRKYTLELVGKFAFIPPTLVSPCEFRLGTLNYLT